MNGGLDELAKERMQELLQAEKCVESFCDAIGALRRRRWVSLRVRLIKWLWPEMQSVTREAIRCCWPTDSDTVPTLFD